MATVRLSMDGKEITARKGQNLLQVAWANWIAIPALCYDQRLKPYGACRLCLVEIKGAKGLIPACATEVADGMEVTTDSEPLRLIRKSVLELLLSDHPNDCMTCDRAGACLLQDLAYKYGAKWDRYQGERHAYPIRNGESEGVIERDYNKCILCGRCARICDEVEAVSVYDFMGRGFDSTVTTPNDRPLSETNCEFCGQCVSSCPVGALTAKSRRGRGRHWEMKPVITVCPYCGVGCQLRLHLKGNEIVWVDSPQSAEPNRGNLCVKGRFGQDFVNHPDRLKKPLIKENGDFREASWEEAVSLVASRLKDIKAKHGAQTIVGLNSTKVTNEENFIFQKFMRTVVGNNNVDHSARLCHAASAVALSKALGIGAPSGTMTDIGSSRAIVVIGSNTTETHPVVGLEVKKAVRQKGATLILIDSRRLKLAEFATIWLRPRHGTNIAVLNSLAQVILQEGLADEAFVKQRTDGFEEFRAILDRYRPEDTEQITGIPAGQVREAARLLGEAEAACFLWGMGITQFATGTDAAFAVTNLAMLTGNLGRPGTGVFPLRGQNNVQGAGDMGGPTALPGYQDFTDPVVREKFETRWGEKLPQDKGLTIPDMFEGALKGEIKAMYVMGENPMMSNPDIKTVNEALDKLDFLVVQDIFLTETAALADVVLPSVTYAEKEGTYTNTERRVQRLRRAVSPVGEARADWEIIQVVAQKMGADWDYVSPAEIMEELADLTPSYHGIRYGRLDKVRNGIMWPCPTRDHPGTALLYKEKFATKNGRALFHPVEWRLPAEMPDDDYPLLLTTGRLLPHWHTGTMSRRSKSLSHIAPRGEVEISPEDAANYGLQNGDEVTLESRRGSVRISVRVTGDSPPGTVFLPFHWNESPANVLTNPAMDPVSKTPEFKIAAVRLQKS